MEMLKTIYAAIGAPYPIASLIIVATLGALLFGSIWLGIGKQYNKAQADTSKAGVGSVASVNQTGVLAGVINNNITVNNTTSIVSSPLIGGDSFAYVIPQVHDQHGNVPLAIRSVGKNSLAGVKSNNPRYFRRCFT